MTMDEQQKIEWLKSQIYRPKERVRARRLENGQWEVFDGLAVYTFDDGTFKDGYELAAQSQRIDKEHGQYEYH